MNHREQNLCEKYDNRDWMDFLTGEQSEESREQMQNHLRKCVSCKQAVNELQAIKEQGSNWYRGDTTRLPDDRKNEMISQITGADSSRKSTSIDASFLIREWLTSAAAAAVLFVVSMITFYFIGPDAILRHPTGKMSLRAERVLEELNQKNEESVPDHLRKVDKGDH